MARIDELRAEIKRLNREYNALPLIEKLPAEDIARESGVSVTTVQRYRAGEHGGIPTAKKLLPFLNDCPCCGQTLPAPTFSDVLAETIAAATANAIKTGGAFAEGGEGVVEPEPEVYVEPSVTDAEGEVD